MKRFSSVLMCLLLAGGLLLAACTSAPAPTGTPASVPATGTSSPAATALSATLTSQIDAVFAPWDRPDSPGCAIGLGREGKVEYARGYGMADLEHAVPITASTIFNAGSLSKQFTGLAVAMLIQEGKLSLDDDVRKYLPEMPDYGQPIKLSNLLYQTSGIRDEYALAGMAGVRNSDLLTVSDMLNLIYRQRGLNFTPGSEYYYSNSNYTLLAQIIERVTGQPLAKFAAERIFGPLGLAHTRFLVDPNELVPGRAYGYALAAGGGHLLDMPNHAIPGPSSLQTSVEDLIRWADNYSTGQAGGMDVVRLATTPGATSNGQSANYAFGLGTSTDNNLGLLLTHSGLDGGYASTIAIFPERRVAVALLCNLGTIDTQALLTQAATIYLAGGKASPATSAPAPAPTPTVVAEPVITLPPEDLAALAGPVANPADGQFRRLFVEGGKLKIEEQPGLEFAPVAADRLQVYQDGQLIPAELRIVTEAGATRRLDLMVAGALDSTWSAYPVLPSGGSDYTGTYYSPELDTVYRLSMERGVLTLDSRVWPHTALLPQGGGHFVAALGLPQVLADFTTDGAGRVTGFTFSLDRARGVRFEKQ